MLIRLYKSYNGTKNVFIFILWDIYKHFKIKINAFFIINL